jgi:hypothetical protein
MRLEYDPLEGRAVGNFLLGLSAGLLLSLFFALRKLPFTVTSVTGVAAAALSVAVRPLEDE